MAALFTIAKLWKQPRCPTTDKWIKKMWYLYTMEFYSAMKKNEILSFATKWMELENIILSVVSQAQKTKNHIFSLICGLQILGKYSNVVGLGSHDKGRAHMGGMGVGKKPKNWKCLMSPLHRHLHQTLKQQEVNMRRESGTSEKVSLR
jgi:proteasome assembly chaperone (PAC2) family protein